MAKTTNETTKKTKITTPLSFQGNFHWVDRITIEVYPLKVEGESNQVVKIRFFAEDKIHDNGGEITAFTNHKFVDMKAEVKKNLTTILINKKEGKNG